MSRGLALVLAAALAGVATGADEGIARFQTGADADALFPQERVLWGLGDEADQALRNQGALLGDPALDAYLQGIVDRLFPEFDGRMRGRFIKSTQVNAFMQPNGSTYMFIGMLNHIDSEAQLAAIMAHEGGHFVDRHSYRRYKSASGMAVFGQLVSLGGVPLAGELIAVSSIMGFSRQTESDADAIAAERLARAGYDLREAKRPFEALVAHLKVNKAKEPFFFSSHPKLQDRVDFFAAAEAKAPPGGDVRLEEYRRITEPARLAVLADLAKRRSFNELIYMLEDDGRRARYPASARHWLAVAYQQRNGSGDAARAEAEFVRTIAEAPEFAPPHKALGELRMRQPERKAEARAHFNRYLELAPAADDRRYVELYLSRLGPEDQTP